MSRQTRETGAPMQPQPIAVFPGASATRAAGRGKRVAIRSDGAPEADAGFDMTTEDLYRAGDLARAEIARADSKAGLLAAIAIPITGVLLAAPSLANLHSLNLILAWASAACMFAGIGYLGSVVWPQLRGNVGICYLSSARPEQLVRTMMDFSNDLDGRRNYAAIESTLLARLATTKFRRIQRAILCLGAGTILIFVTSISFTVSVLI